MKKLMIVLLILSVASLCVSCGNETVTEQPETVQPVSETESSGGTDPQPVPVTERMSYEGNGFDTPEAAVLFFLNGMKNLDFEQMLDAYAWETRVSRFSSREYLMRYRTISDNMIWLPG